MNQEKVLEKEKYSHVQKLPHFFFLFLFNMATISLISSRNVTWEFGGVVLVSALNSVSWRRYRFEFLAVIILETHFQVQSHRKETATSWFQGAKIS